MDIFMSIFFRAALLLLVVVEFCCILSVEGVVMIFHDSRVYEYDSIAADFGEKFDVGVQYHGYLTFPEQAMNSENRIFPYHLLCKVPEIDILEFMPSRKLGPTKKALPLVDSSTVSIKESYYDSFNQVNGRKKFRKLGGSSKMERAILVRRGGCSFEQKARIAIALNEKYLELLNITNNKQWIESRLIKYVIVYDNRPEKLSSVTKMIGNGKGVNLKLLFVDSKSGMDLSSLVYQRFNESDVKSDLAKVGLPISMDSERLFGSDEDVLVGVASGAWMRIFLCTILIVFPCFRCCIIWHAAGGRIRIYRENGRLRFHFQPPSLRWISQAMGAGIDDDVSRGNCVSKEVVLALPEITYNCCSCKYEMLYQSKSEKTKTGSECTCRAIDEADAVDFKKWSSCSICLEDFEDGEKLRLLPCGHIFHTDCIIPWVTERQGCCPFCKTSIIENKDESNNSEDVRSEYRYDNTTADQGEATVFELSRYNNDNVEQNSSPISTFEDDGNPDDDGHNIYLAPPCY